VLNPDFDPAPVAVRIYRIQYFSKCKVPQLESITPVASSGISSRDKQALSGQVRGTDFRVR